MAAEDHFTLTRRGYERLQAELVQFKSEQAHWRDEMQQLYTDVDRNNDEEAADFDLRTRKEFADQRIGHLTYVLERAEVTDDDPNPKQIDPGERVTVWDLEAREERTFELVNGEETKYAEGAVSTDSPVGKALIGRSIGDTIQVDIPDGWVRYCIRAVERIEG